MRRRVIPLDVSGEQATGYIEKTELNMTVKKASGLRRYQPYEEQVEVKNQRIISAFELVLSQARHP